jgi:hypothetical protein
MALPNECWPARTARRHHGARQGRCADLIFGLALGLLLIPVAGKVIGPAWQAIKGMFRRKPAS